MKPVVLFALLWGVICFGSQLMAKKEIGLVVSSQSEYQILIPKEPIESVREGAFELQRLLKKSTGAYLPITHDFVDGQKYIMIGACPRAESVQVSPLSHDAFKIKMIKGGHLVLKGKDEGVFAKGVGGQYAIRNWEKVKFYNLKRWRRSLSAGSYNAVIQFARDYLGARWYMPGPLGEEVERKESLRVAFDLDVEMAPYFKMRRFDFTDFDAQDLKDPDYDWDTLHKTTRWGRRLRHTNNRVLANAHSWRNWIPADQISAPWIANELDMEPYGATHPDFFALVRGKRQSRYTTRSQHGGQLCVSNSELIDEYSRNLIRYGQKNTQQRMFGLGQNDGGNHCECANCKAWDVTNEKADGRHAHLTDRMVRFQNEVVKQVSAVLPNAEFSAMAYHSTGLAPIKETPDARIHFVSYYNYLPYRYHLSKSKAELESALEGWRLKTQKFYFGTFYFAYGNYSLPWSTPDVHEWMIEQMVENQHLGLMIYYHEHQRVAPGALGPDIWLLSQLLWNPEQNVGALVDEWYEGAFGSKVGPLMREYFDLINQRMTEEIKRYPRFWNQRTASQKNIDIAVFQGIRKECRTLIDRAVAVSANLDERYQWRVDRVAKNWRFTELTLDALAAFRKSRIEPSKVHFEAALTAGIRYKAYSENPDNLYAVSPRSVVASNRDSLMNILSERPRYPIPEIRVPPAILPDPVIDGDLSDRVWKKEGVPAGGHKKPFKNNQTSAKIVKDTPTYVTTTYTDRGLYFMFWGKELHMQEQVINDDPAQLWKGDVFDVFIAPSGGEGGYFQFQVNPNGKGAAYAYRGDKGLDRDWEPDWSYAGAKFKTGWGAEIFVPWATLEVVGPPKAGDQWFINYCRERYTHIREDSAWSPTGGPFGTPSKFGRLVFIGKGEN